MYSFIYFYYGNIFLEGLTNWICGPYYLYNIVQPKPVTTSHHYCHTIKPITWSALFLC